jgi:nitrate reductase gamma subunit
MDLYELARGPLAGLALIVFVVGSFLRIGWFLAWGTRVKGLSPTTAAKDGLRAIFRGLIPFGTTYMRRKPVFTVITFLFHLGVLITPLFLLAHSVLLYESWQIEWWSLPDVLADTMTLAVIFATFFFLVRRLIVPEVKQVSRATDILLLLLILICFLSAFLAYHQLGPYHPLLILHVISGDILLLIFPFSRLFHMVLFFFTRASLGSEFGPMVQGVDW